MTDQGILFGAVDHDPLRPGLDEPTPIELIMRLTGPERRQRVEYLVEQAHGILATAVASAAPLEVVGTVLCFSGGNDSTVLGHLFRNTVNHVVHVNTGIGIPETNQFVRDVTAAWGLPLIEKEPPPGATYQEQVLANGFPGPAFHFRMYQRLKERGIRSARADLVRNGRKQRVVFLSGRRRAESARRADIPLTERDGSLIWAAPMAMWTKLDMQTYRLMHPDVPRNRVADLIGMSGECLCGAFAKPGELDEIGAHFPGVRAHIEGLEALVTAAGHCEPWNRWGHGQRNPDVPAEAAEVGMFCTSCTTQDPLWDLIEKEAEAMAIEPAPADDFTAELDSIRARVADASPDLVRAVNAVLELHSPFRQGGMVHCAGCEDNSDGEYQTAWPCGTIDAVTGVTV